MALKLHNCIMFFPRANSELPMKYRNVNNLEKFRRFAMSKGAIYFNVYDKDTRSYNTRIWIPENFPSNVAT
jgi:hypothetical protein